MRVPTSEPIVELLARVELLDETWTLSLRHRHADGLIQDCRPDIYERLSLSELVDVLLVHVEVVAEHPRYSLDR